MDETLITKGTRDFRTSPCYDPLLKLLRLKNDVEFKLLVVTSDDGYRPFAVWDSLTAGNEELLFGHDIADTTPKDSLSAGKILFSTSGG